MREKPMPLDELPDYIRSVREHGQGDAPVVDMGRIVSPNRSRSYLLVAAGLLLALGVYVARSTDEITIESAAGVGNVAEIVSGEGGSVISVKRDGDGKYRVRVFSFGGVRSLVERLRESEEFDSVGLD